jgi:hypothetical protein
MSATATDPQPVIDGRGATILGPRNVPVEKQNPDVLVAFGVGAWATALVMPRQHPSVLWPARVTAGLIACAVVQLVFWVVWLAVGGHPGSTLMVLLGILAFAMGHRLLGRPMIRDRPTARKARRLRHEL